MDKNRIKILIERLESGDIQPEELTALEKIIENENITLEDIPQLYTLANKLDAIEVPEPSMHLKSGFYEMLEKDKSLRRKNLFEGISIWLENLGWSPVAINLTYAMVLIITGIGIGLWISSPSEKSEIKNLTSEIQEIKEVMMLTLLEKPSATERLRAVNLSGDLDLKNVDKKVITALVETLKNDENVNVRLATVEALFRYADHPEARKGLVKAIAYQESPLVQVALAEAMVLLKETSSVEELRELLKIEGLEKGVKEKVKESIEILS